MTRALALALSAAAVLAPRAAAAQVLQRFSLHLEGVASGVMSAPQKDRFTVGGGASLRVGVTLAGPLALHVAAGTLRWPAADPTGSTASTVLFGGGLRVAPTFGGLVTLLLEAEGGGSVNGGDRALLPWVGGGAGVLFRVAPVLDLGPVFRVGALLPREADAAGNGGTGAAVFWSAGLSIGLHAPPPEPVAPPAEEAPRAPAPRETPEVEAPTVSAPPAPGVPSAPAEPPVQPAQVPAPVEAAPAASPAPEATEEPSGRHRRHRRHRDREERGGERRHRRHHRRR